jgi:hypothetical protein
MAYLATLMERQGAWPRGETTPLSLAGGPGKEQVENMAEVLASTWGSLAQTEKALIRLQV